ncbi:MAG: hypothetical protein JWO63_868, partial [Frankiales bacterium]|nr:hypothetical protein [Frankiales bacterium]
MASDASGSAPAATHAAASATTPAASLTDALRRATDAELIALLRKRPDLALPAPVDLATLASRASVRSSIARALDGLDAFTLRVLEVVTVLGSGTGVDEVRDWFAEVAPATVLAAVGRLRDLLLIWGEDDDLHPAGAVREVLGPYPAGLGRTAADLFAMVNDMALAPLLRRLGLPPATQPASGRAVTAEILERLPEFLANCDEAEQAILGRLAVGPPIGVLRNAASGQGPEAASPARTLVLRGLLVPVDRDTVELPREVSLALRSQSAGLVDPRPPQVEVTDRETSVIDGGGGTAVLDTVRLTELLLESIAHEPPVQLRAGGLGVRDLRRLSRVLDTSESRTALLLEVAFEAGLLAPTAHADPSYLPSTEYDAWLRRDTAARWV